MRELEDELLRQDLHNRIVTPKELAIATARLNSRVRAQGLSAREIWYQRDQFNHDQLPLSDRRLIQQQNERRQSNHVPSEKSEVPRGVRHLDTDVTVGDLVYLFADRNKHHPHDRYLVVSVDGSWCNIKKISGAQLRSSSYRVKRCECYKVKEATTLVKRSPSSSDESLSDLSAPVVPAETRIHIPAPSIPSEISSPLPPAADPGESHPTEIQEGMGDESATSDEAEAVVPADLNQEAPQRHSTRTRKPPRWLKDFVVDVVNVYLGYVGQNNPHESEGSLPL